MEVINRMVSETRRLSMEEDDSRSEVNHLKNELLLEEQNISLTKQDLENLCQQSTSLQQSLNSCTRHSDLVKTFRSVVKSSTLLLKFFVTFIEQAIPTTEQQLEKINYLQSEYCKMLQKYEDGPTYHAILQEEAKERELSKLIMDKKNEAMKLETEQEF